MKIVLWIAIGFILLIGLGIAVLKMMFSECDDDDADVYGDCWSYNSTRDHWVEKEHEEAVRFRENSKKNNNGE